ncbi:MAG: HEAT repeat domain-containing protein [Firmicutes bacterium]|nr:HEAT repeat domain-containing protein [Bacillota bacterium]
MSVRTLATGWWTSLACKLGLFLVKVAAPFWVWEFLIRYGGRVGEAFFVCLAGGGRPAEEARRYFAAAPADLLPLLMRVAREHPSWEVRLGAFNVLLWRKEPEALRFLAGLLRDRSWYLKGLAGERAGEEVPPWPVILGPMIGFTDVPQEAKKSGGKREVGGQEGRLSSGPLRQPAHGSRPLVSGSDYQGA